MRLLPVSAHIFLLLTLLAAFGCEGVVTEPLGDPRAERPGAARCATLPRDPGHVTIHRLNRVEYNNTVRDLLGDTTRPADDFPMDAESRDGLINDADLLTVGTLALQKYSDAALVLANEAMARTSFQSEYLTCDLAGAGDEACAEDFIRGFASDAWRRPVTDEEVTRLMSVTSTGMIDQTFDDGVELTIRAILLSPNFMFRAEPHGDGSLRDLDGWEVASRLSYFLWGSMPDDELYRLAERGELNEEATLRAQAERMLEHENFQVFLNEFVARWLQVEDLSEVQPSAELYPGFDDELRTAMNAETRMFVQHVIENDLPIATLLDADFTFLNERLATHYGIAGVTGAEMRRVDVGLERGGLLTQGSILAVTSHPNRTSPVRRGQYVLDRLLCAPQPDPPANVDALSDEETDPSTGANLTLRERLEAHRADPICAGCHAAMDPIGLALENFDGTGAWRTLDNDIEIDASGRLPDGSRFDGAAELSLLLTEDERFETCVAEKLTSYSLGRSLTETDFCMVDDIIQSTNETGMTFRNLIIETVMSGLFRTVGETAQ